MVSLNGEDMRLRLRRVGVRAASRQRVVPVVGVGLLGLVGLALPASAQMVTQWGDRGYNWVGDFNGDGRDDVASAHPDGTVTMRFSTGSGFNRATWTVPTEWGGSQYTWAEDFNGDGKTDLVSALENQIFVHLAGPDGFQTRTLITEERWGEPGYNWAGDFNGDGRMDLASAHPDGTVTLRLFSLTPQNEAEFSPEVWTVPTPWGGSQYTWAEDFDGDGKTDLVSALETNLYIHLSTGTGVQSRTLSASRWGEPGYNRAGDFNGDRRIDLASALPGGEVVIRLFDGSEVQPVTWFVQTPWGGANYTWAADFDADGVTDFVSALETNTFEHISEADGFRSQTLQISTWGEPGYNWAGDFNGDGRMDLMAVLPESGIASMRLAADSGFDVVTW